MALSGEEMFVFTWQIENFSMCPQQVGEFIDSPIFKVPFLSEREWNIRLYPRGDKKANWIACYLQQGLCLKAITIGFTITALSVNAHKDIKTRNEMTVSTISGFSDFANREDILKTVNGLLPNDILTIKCHMWSFAQITKPVELDSTSFCYWNSTNTSKCNECKAVTRIKVGSISVLWAIPRFHELQPNRKLRKYVNSTMNGEPSFEITFYLKEESQEEECAHIEIHRKNTSIKCENLFLRGEIKTIRAPKVAILKGHDEHHFKIPKKDVETDFFKPTVTLPQKEGSFNFQPINLNQPVQPIDFEAKTISIARPQVSGKAIRRVPVSHVPALPKESKLKHKENDDTWRFPEFIKKKDLEKKKYFTYTNGVLYLQFKFSFSTTGYDVKSENFDTSVVNSYIDNYNSLRINYQELYEDKTFSDVVLRVKDRDFKVHKSILSLRSDVFRTMFETKMREQETGIVEITDMDLDTVDRLLMFMYTDVLEDLSYENAAKLYSAAEKYNVSALKWRCCCILMSSLTVSNVCGTLELAHLHQDEDLLEAVRTFICKNANETFYSEDWNNLMRKNSQLAADTMHYILTNNID